MRTVCLNSKEYFERFRQKHKKHDPTKRDCNYACRLLYRYVLHLSSALGVSVAEEGQSSGKQITPLEKYQAP